MKISAEKIVEFILKDIEELERRASRLEAEGNSYCADLRKESVFTLKCLYARIQGWEDAYKPED